MDYKDDYSTDTPVDGQPLSLASFAAEPTVDLKRYTDKAIVYVASQANLEERVPKKIEIPEGFKESIFCRSIIDFLYTDDFKRFSDRSKEGDISIINNFFSFLSEKESSLPREESWKKLIQKGGDLPHTVIHQFALYESENGAGANTAELKRRRIVLSILKLSTLNEITGERLTKHWPHLEPYVNERVLPEIKLDDKTPKPALSQLFEVNYRTGEPVKCPFTDSQLVINIRWFAVWFLNLMSERREFMRQVMWNTEQTIYEVVKEKLDSKEWSLDTLPVSSVSQAFGRRSFETFFEASQMYAKIYDAMLPNEDELAEIKEGNISSEMEKRLVWLEPMGFSSHQAKKLKLSICDFESAPLDIVERVETRIERGLNEATTGQNNRIVRAPHLDYDIRLKSSYGRGTIIITPYFSLANLFIPTFDERLIMNWLLASDSIQKSGQKRLKLSDLKRINRNKITIPSSGDADIDSKAVSEVKARYHKKRGKGSNINSPGKDHDTISYQKGDPIYGAYTKWDALMSECQKYLKKNNGKWFHHYPADYAANKLLNISFMASKSSLISGAYRKHEEELPFHSEQDSEGATDWLFKTYFQTYRDFNEMKAQAPVAGIRMSHISAEYIRQSRIIFEEGQPISDKENAAVTGHGKQMVYEYRKNGLAKERIINGLKGNRQVADKMIEEALSIIDSCHFLSVDEVNDMFHKPKGTTAKKLLSALDEMSEQSSELDLNVFGAIQQASSDGKVTKIINDEDSAWMMWSYIQHMESDLEAVGMNHPEKRVAKHIVEHAMWSVLFERFPADLQQKAKELTECRNCPPYPPLF